MDAQKVIIQGFLSTNYSLPCQCVLSAGGLNVSCIPLQAMVDATGLLDINLFSLDVEGGELSVLSTLDLEATNIQVVVVELDGRSPDKDEQAIHPRAQALQQHGVLVKKNRFCTHFCGFPGKEAKRAI